MTIDPGIMEALIQSEIRKERERLAKIAEGYGYSDFAEEVRSYTEPKLEEREEG